MNIIIATEISKLSAEDWMAAIFALSLLFTGCLSVLIYLWRRKW